MHRFSSQCVVKRWNLIVSLSLKLEEQPFTVILLSWSVKDSRSKSWANLSWEKSQRGVIIIQFGLTELQNLNIFNTRTGIYSSSFINVRFWAKIEFSNDLFQDKRHESIIKCRWGSTETLSSRVSSWRSLGVGSRDKGSKKFWSFYIWRAN